MYDEHVRVEGREQMVPLSAVERPIDFRTLTRQEPGTHSPVLSFDLVSDNAYVVEADTCARVPLPGSEPSPDSGSSEGEGQIVDVVICALSLMGTNWPGCIREAWRILRSGYVPSVSEMNALLKSQQG